MLKSRKTIDIKNENEKIIIKFPFGIGMLICYIVVFICIIVAAIWVSRHFREILDRANTFQIILLILACILIFLGNIVGFIMLFIRKVIIDKEKKQITYISFYKKSFDIQSITKMECKIKYGDGSTAYFLLIWHNDKKIKIETQSDEQSQSLKDIINSLTA